MSNNVTIKLVSGEGCIGLLHINSWKCLHIDILLFSFLLYKKVCSQERTQNMAFKVAAEYQSGWFCYQTLLELNIYKIRYTLLYWDPRDTQ